MQSAQCVGAVAALTAAGAAYTVARPTPAALPRANTPIEHVVVILGENQSFDHYFGTYPKAANLPGIRCSPPSAGRPRSTAYPDAAGAATRTPTRAPGAAPTPSPATQPQLRGRAAGVQRRRDEPLRREHGRRLSATPIVMAYYDGNTRHGDVELRAELRDERPPLRLDVRAVDDRRHQPRRGNTHGVSPPAVGENGTMIANSQPALDDCSAGRARASRR